MKVIILTEGGNKLGLGHIVRCLALCDALKREDVSVKFIVLPDPSTEKLLKNIPHKSFDWIKDKNKLLAQLNRVDVVIIDSTIAPKEIYDEVGKSVRIPVFFDDYHRISYPKGILINRAPGTKINDYPKNGSLYLLGENFLPLPNAFWNAEKKVIKEDIGNILITFGGSDPKQMTEKVLDLINKAYPNISKTVIVGSANNFKKYNFKNNIINFIFAPDSAKMKQLMQESDLAISACGQTLYELARMGVPTIGIKVAENQIDNISSLTKLGFLEYAGDYKSPGTMKNVVRISEILADKNPRAKRSKKGQKIIDGFGAIRIASYLILLSNTYEK